VVFDLTATAAKGVRWLALAGVSVAIVGLMLAISLPAAWLLGPLVGAAGFAVRGLTLRLPRPATVFAQAVLGTFLSSRLTPELLGDMRARWPVFLFGALSVVLLSAALGWVLTWQKVLPGSTAVWGTAPGAAMAMVVMAEAFGADAQLVALMQYSRVALVVMTAAVVSRVMGATPPPAVVFVAHPGAIAVALGVAMVGAVVGLRTKVPAGALLVPMVLGLALPQLGLPLELPPGAIALAATLLGWGIGLSFTRASLTAAAKLFPRMLLSILALVVTCTLLAVALSLALHLDLLTVWLATSPGGMDSVALIAAASHVDVSFVIALQAMRFLAVMVLGPPLSKLVAISAQRRAGPPDAR
jgi:uncharacterized protein